MRKLSKFFIKTLIQYAALHSEAARLNGKVGLVRTDSSGRAGNKVSSVYPPGKPFGREVNYPLGHQTVSRLSSRTCVGISKVPNLLKALDSESSSE